MRQRAVVLVLLFVAGCAAPETPPAARVPGRALFDGRTLDGWEGDPRFWRVEDGAIVGESTSACPLAQTTYLTWRGGEVGDFELELDWRLQGGNSGVQFRSRVSSPTDVAGYQADLEAGPDWTGGLYEQDGRGVVTRRGERVVLDANGGKTAERFADGAALLARVVPAGWNHLRIVAFGPRLTIEVNGELFSETIDLDPARAARRGALAFQLHQGAPMRVEFRNIELRPLAMNTSPASQATRGSWAVDGYPAWIWPQGTVADGQEAWFRRDFTLSAAPRAAELWVTCDNEFDLWLNGAGVATSDVWTEPVRVDVTAQLRAGANQLLVRGANVKEEAGLCLHLALENEDGTSSALESDTSWLCALADERTPKGGDALREWLDQAQWKAPQSFGGLDAAPWTRLRSVPAQPTFAPDGSQIQVPTGFHVELLHSVDLASQGSWVALAVDPLGRLYASDQYGGIQRVTPAALGTSAASEVEPLRLPLGEAQGLVWAFGSLYAVVNGAGKYASGLYRAFDSDGDGELDRVECLRRFDGDGEHGPHGIALGPDGALYIVAGNYTKLPEPIDVYRRPRNWGEDALLPRILDPNGHAVDCTAPGGWIARTDRKGSRWELFAAGFRNPYDLAFSPEGELFTYDSDMEWDAGLPWYKPTRILHVVSGAEFGWRTSSSNWPADSFDALPSVLDLGLASPTGVVFGTHARFPEKWRRALFAGDWAYGRVFAVFLEPEGASFRGSAEVFASGKPFQVTDMVVGPDGALYLTTGGRQTQSGLYRITWTGEVPAADVAVVKPTHEEFQRGLRLAAEAEHGPRSRPAPEVAASWIEPDYEKDGLTSLAVDDRHLRYARRIALEHEDPTRWGPLALGEKNPRAALEALLALVHCDPAADAHQVVERALGIFDASRCKQDRRDALRLIELALLRLAAGDEVRARIRGALDGAYPSGDERLDRALLGLLVSVEAPVAERALARLDAATTQEERIAVLYALRVLHAGWSEASARRLLAALDVELERLKGGLSARGYVEKIRAEAQANLAELGVAAASAHEETRATPGGAEAPPVSLAGRRSHAWRVAELEPALARLAAGRDFERGRALYTAASCAQCHRFAGEGANLGPDLTGAAGRYAPRDLLVATLEPSREVPDVWRDTEFWAGDELLAVGRLEEERDGMLHVHDVSGASVSVPAALVTERRAHKLSRMPDGLLDPLDADEILDLLAYVLSGGDAQDARFATR